MLFVYRVRTQVLTMQYISIPSTIWYELQARGWPLTNQPAEATIWQVGSGEGIKKVLAKVSLGKEVTVRSKSSVMSSGKLSILY